MEENIPVKKKGHREPHSGRKAEKKKAKKGVTPGDGHKNPKAFTFNSAVRAQRTFRRGQDILSKKHHVPVVDRTPLEPPPILVAIVGPPKVGKSLLIQCLIKTFTRQPLTTIKGPVTVVSGKKRRITLIECNNDINSMIDLAKVCDLVLLLIDASFGFEMEIFEFLNICQVHGMPKVMGVLTHLDIIKNSTAVKKIKKTLKHRFWTEVYAGAKLFYLSGILHNEYLRNEIKNLGRFISVMKFRPLIWQTTHPYLLADRMEDLTSPELIRQNEKVDRSISLYGYMRGIPLNKRSFVHIPGCGDFHIKDVSLLPDPCPLPEKLKKRALGEKERLIYAPFSGVGGIVYDKDSVYIDLPNGANHLKNKSLNSEPVQELVSSLLKTKSTLTSKIEQSELQLFSNAPLITASEFVGDSVDSGLPAGSTIEHVNDNGRERRKVIFSDDITGNDNKMDVDDSDGDDNDDDDKNDESDLDIENSSDDENEENKIKKNNVNEKSNRCENEGGNVITNDKGNNQEEKEEEDADDDDDDDNDDDDEEEEGDDDTGIKWKSNLAQKATDAFLERQATSVNLWKLVYGNNDVEEEDEHDTDNEDEGEEGLFKIVKQKEERKILEKDVMGTEDITARFSSSYKKSWESDEVCNSIKDCFVTGKWKKSEDAFRLIQNGVSMDYDDADNDDDEFCDGDFEDLETGEKHVAKKEDSDDKENNEDEIGKNSNKESLTHKERLEKKKKLKERFNSEYDDDKDGGGKSYYDELKEEANKQAELNRAQFEGLDEALRVQLEGFRAGLYVRIEFDSVPCELVQNFDPAYPLIVGSLQPGEENVGYVKARIKKHRWFERILKTKDPLIFSVGWRRFQTVPVYSKLEDNLRHRMLKYTPEHVACMVHFWGPLTSAGTGILAVKDVASCQPGFRIVITGAVVDTNQTTEITKKLKLTGVPIKIYKKTAFIRGMFNTTLEVAKFEGARIKTVSGIRGQIKKAVNKPEGAFRATFEDKIKLSDIIFCRTWFKVDVPKLYNPVTSLLLPVSEKNTWQGMKSMWQLKQEHNIRNEPQKDSLYSEIKRERPSFAPFRVPKKLQKELPYRDKPKNRYHINKKKPQIERVAVIRDVEEAKVASLMSKLKSNYKAKVRQLKRDMEKRVKEHRKTVRLEEERKRKNKKEEMKERFKQSTKQKIINEKAKNKRRKH